MTRMKRPPWSMAIEVSSKSVCSSALAMLLLLSSGCALRDLREQVQLMEQTCRLEGRVSRPESRGQRVVVALKSPPGAAGQPPIPVDYVLADDSGGYGFSLAPGDYRLLAFLDYDDNLALDDAEPAAHIEGGEAIRCGPGEQRSVQPIELDESDRLARNASLSVERSRSLVQSALDAAVSIGQLTAFGEIAELDDPRFALEVARDSLWRPMDFVRAGHSGVYLRESLDPDRVPVLFIHGINGSPRVLEPMIESLDTDRLQPMYFYYASGLGISQVASHLYRIMREIESRESVERYHVIAHSMGGLVARAWLLERLRRGGEAEIGGVITLSTPWGGYDSARQGVRYSPVVAPVWRDLATGSAFLDGLFGSERDEEGRLPRHHLLFGYRLDSWAAGSSGDGVATLQSMLPAAVQRSAASVFGVDAGHVDILESDLVQRHVQRLLSDLEDTPPAD